MSRGVRLRFSKHIVFLSDDIFFTLTNSVDPDFAAFNLVFTICRGFPYTMSN